MFNGIKNESQRNGNIINLQTLNQITMLLDTMCFQSQYVVRRADSNYKYVLKSELEVVRKRPDLLMTCILLASLILQQPVLQNEILNALLTFL